ncbi:hypothetical protein [Streptomyces sp. RFCAC02]|uniref:hypothetical protein n=1 Tax=Streptomyces sp. RFCAC02 TaxID=2499143 RepID=UPI00101F3514|nr:hypothetical protein [Streptomyces sp. RFCAC02]
MRLVPRSIRRLGMVAGVAAAAVLATATQANAQAAPQNVGWLYTGNGSGAVFFDADLAGYASQEKITVCDNTANGWGIEAVVQGTSPSGVEKFVTLRDPSSDGHCASVHANYFADGYFVWVTVYEYAGDSVRYTMSAQGVA